MASTGPSRKTLVGIRYSGPSLERAAAVVKSFMFEASGREAAGGAGAENLLGFRVDDEQPAGRAAALVEPGAHLVAAGARLGSAGQQQEKAC